MSLQSGHIIKRLFERFTTHFLQDRSLKSLGTFKDCIEYISPEIKTYVSKNWFNLFLWPCQLEVLLFHTKWGKLFWEQKLYCCCLVRIILSLLKKIHLNLRRSDGRASWCHIGLLEHRTLYFGHLHSRCFWNRVWRFYPNYRQVSPRIL